MYAPNDNTAPKGLRGWWAAPPRSGMRRMISPWERTSRSFSIGAILVVVSLVLVGCMGRHRLDAGQERCAPAEDLPPHGSDGFWSITLYNAAGSLAANPIDRYSIGDDSPGLVRGADRSLTIVVSASRPVRRT